MSSAGACPVQPWHLCSSEEGSTSEREVASETKLWVCERVRVCLHVSFC